MTTVIAAYVLFLLNFDGTHTTPVAQLSNQEACVVASYRVSFGTGKETRCDVKYSVAPASMALR